MKDALAISPSTDSPTGTAVSPAVQSAALAVEQTFRKERKRLLAFIRKRVPEPDDAEDILQDVFYQLLERLEPIEQVTAWLFRVARNKIIDRYRKRKPESLEGLAFPAHDDDGTLQALDWLFEPNNNPENQYARTVIWEELTEALGELPIEQRNAFVMHELEGKSFKEMSRLTGASVNTLLSRKRYAVLHLRERLANLYKDLVNN